MNKQVLVWLVLVVAVCSLMGCADDDDSAATDDPWDTGGDTGTEDTESGSDMPNYVCIDDTEPIDEAVCGPYPEQEIWDMDAVVPNMQFKAYYDRDCDGTVELTTLDLYRDVYCQRDRIKSLALVVGSYCGEQTGQT
ncbi:MAG: hypothetical protein QNJ97_16350 [Myxococcota bacterium]|nr:hypothetical protein [Myxococcota bacterium]